MAKQANTRSGESDISLLSKIFRLFSLAAFLVLLFLTIHTIFFTEAGSESVPQSHLYETWQKEPENMMDSNPEEAFGGDIGYSEE